MRAIVNVGVNGDYPRMSASLKARCDAHCTDSRRWFWIGTVPDGCPSHTESQYGFKVHALRQAVGAGYRRVLWIDSAIMPRKPLDPLWDEIERSGWYVPPQGDAMLGDWCNDSALAIYGIDRATARTIRLAIGKVYGFNLDHPDGARLWALWNLLYDCGAFIGPHRAAEGDMREWGSKTEGFCSTDKGVLGHRHDEAAASYAIWKLGLKLQWLGWFPWEAGDSELFEVTK